MKKHLLYFLIFIGLHAFSQNEKEEIMSFTEYLGYVKKFHPIVKQANLMLKEGEANLLKARGAFDPKLALDYDKKQFKNTNYYDKLNATFKIPTWYGIEFKANFEENTGDFLNAEAFLPQNGLYSAGISIPLARDLLINERMSLLKQAKFFKEQVAADRQLLVNTIIYNASITYFNWLKAYNEKELYISFLKNATLRLNAVKKSVLAGERAAIDTLETGITVNQRKLNLENARINYIKKTLKLSNFLWLENNIPIELQEGIIPDISTFKKIDRIINLNNNQIDSLRIEEHPKLLSLYRKYDGLQINKRLKTNKLLPRIDLEYNFLTQTPQQLNSLVQNQYKGGINIEFPLFLRKERGDLKLSKLKLQDIQYEITSQKIQLKNKLKSIGQELNSLKKQHQYTVEIVRDYKVLLTAENRKFILGESSVFLINSRESKLISSELKAIKVRNTYLKTKANLVKTMALEDFGISEGD